ncbi:MAG TPA: DUF6445 family protein [Acidimicrobiales bacterium]|nr:DUF6445 family protein [Acidimicrobiales bacterium]
MAIRTTFNVGQTVRFAGIEGVVREIGQRAGHVAYLVESGSNALPMWVPHEILVNHQDTQRPSTHFNQHTPHVVCVDDFFRDPDEVRALALAQEYGSDLRYYKGLRTKERFLWPHLREEFGRLLGKPITEWLGYAANGVFQQTRDDDPLVWHHDSQQYAAAVYLNPEAGPGSGTSFWRDKVHGCRRSPSHPVESARLGSPEAVRAAEATVYNPENIQNPDNWELVESVSGLYNRLVIWDAKLIHSATSYSQFTEGGPLPIRLVQLFFFDAE